MTPLSDSTTILAELAILLRLTRTEAQAARIRIGQASTEKVRRELASNAQEIDTRAARIQTTIRRLGGAPDVFAEAVGRVAAIGKATLEQGQAFSEALLTDLALEHQLRDRAVFTRVLAEAENQSAVVTLMEELEEAHTETIAWLTARLAELAQGGPAALSPTPAQAAISKASRIALLPSRQVATLFNKTVNLMVRGRNKIEQAVKATGETVVETTKATGEKVDKATTAAGENVVETAQATGEVAAAGRNVALARAEDVAPSSNVRKAAHQTREELGTLDAADLPIKGYDNMAAEAAIKAIKELDKAEDVDRVLRFEQAHQDRKGVTTAAQKRMSAVASQAAEARDLPVKDYENLSGESVIKAVKDLERAEDVDRVLRFEQAHQDRKGVTATAQKRKSEFAEKSVNA